MPVPIVTIFGGSGFIGRYVAQRMARAGWRVRVAVRRPNEAHFVRPYGFVGQVEPIQANVRDEASTRRAIAGARAVVNCVGVLAESGPQTFEALLDEAPARIARLAAEEGVGQLVHVSAIGADPASDSLYAAAKGRGEAAVAAAFPGAVILRPVDRLRHRGRVLQPLRGDGAAVAGAAADRGRHPLPARLCRRRRRGGGEGRARRGGAGHLRARRAGGRHLPRADVADARHHPAPPDAGRHPVLARRLDRRRLAAWPAG